MKKKLFVMQEPKAINSEQYLFRLYAEPNILEFVENLDCVATVTKFTTMSDQIDVWLNPLYDYEEAWLFIFEQLEIETLKVELDTSIWGN